MLRTVVRYILWASLLAIVVASGLFAYDRLIPPTGERLVASRDEEICVMTAEGQHLRCLRRGEKPRWSPDGKRIVFEIFDMDKKNDTHIFIMDADGSNLTRLTNDIRIDGTPAWSPDGRWIAFSSEQIYVIGIDGSGLRSLTNLRRCSSPDWSPDGQRLVFMASASESAKPDIYVVDSDGGNLKQLTTDQATDAQPRWSPDGQRIVFESNRDVPNGEGGADIYVMNSDGSNQIRLTYGPTIDFTPVWSPDGKQIAFLLNRDGRTTRPLFGSVELDLFQIYVMNADGSNVRQVTHDWFATYRDIDWSSR